MNSLGVLGTKSEKQIKGGSRRHIRNLELGEKYLHSGQEKFLEIFLSFRFYPMMTQLLWKTIKRKILSKVPAQGITLKKKTSLGN